MMGKNDPGEKRSSVVFAKAAVAQKTTLDRCFGGITIE
jgi:hypothetical protein